MSYNLVVNFLYFWFLPESLVFDNKHVIICAGVLNEVTNSYTYLWQFNRWFFFNKESFFKNKRSEIVISFFCKSYKKVSKMNYIFIISFKKALIVFCVTSLNSF